jgi:hypothetical protein
MTVDMYSEVAVALPTKPKLTALILGIPDGA